MQLSTKQIVIIALALAVVVAVVVLVVLGSQPESVREKVTLAVWGYEDPSIMTKIGDAYHALRPNVEVIYAQLPRAGYRDVVLDALAAGRGPDVIMVGNRDLPRDAAKLAPLDPAQFTLIRFRETFPAAAEQDFVQGGSVYAAPLYLDTLALYYNRDLLDQAKIIKPPATWEEFLDAVARLRNVDERGKISRAGAAIGGSLRTIPDAVDLVHLLMIQNGTQMTSPDLSAATFAGDFAGRGPGADAFDFYLQFANASSPYHTWNDSQEGALDSFAAGRTAMLFGYRDALAEIKRKNPFVNVGIAPVPQPAGNEFRIAYPRYAGLAVPAQSRAPAWAWDFALYATTDAQANSLYLSGTSRPPALRSGVEANLADPNYHVFAEQALTARSWHQADPDVIQAAFNAAIQDVLLGRAASSQALLGAQETITQLMRSRL